MKNVRDYNVGKSDYAKHKIQPWDIILEYGLNYWDGDIIKRILRTKEGESRRLDYEKIIHICQERIRQIDMTEPCYQGEQEDRDETTVFCLSESDNPKIKKYDYGFKVYSVFKSEKGYWYAYLGYDKAKRYHAYMQLTGDSFTINPANEELPLGSILKSSAIDRKEHNSSVKIGRCGDKYASGDYIISYGVLCRYHGVDHNGRYVYSAFRDSYIERITSGTKLFNNASQETLPECEK